MPSVAPRTMSPGELAICEDVLDSHRQYALDLMSNMEKICRWHSAESCIKTKRHRACTVCELCDVNGLMGATKKALTSYDAAERHLQEVRAALGSSAAPLQRGAHHRETLFKSKLAKAVFVSVVGAGDKLRSQRATWQTRLQNDMASSAPNLPRDAPGLVLPAFSGPGVVGPETMPNSTMFVVFKQRLSTNCRVANKKTAAGEVASRVPLSPSNSNLSPGAAHSASDHAIQSTVTNSRRRPRASTSDTSSKAKAQAQKPLDSPRALYRKNEPSLTLTAVSTQSQSPQNEALILDPRVFRLRAQISRSDDARRMLIAWCRAWMVELQLDPLERHGTPEISLTHESMTKGMNHPSALAPDLEPLESEKSLPTIDQVGEITTHKLSRRDIETTIQDQRFDSEQEELERLWLAARKQRCKQQRKRHPAFKQGDNVQC